MTRPDPTPLPRRYLRHGMLPQLAAFEAVVRLGSVRRAADALCLAPATVSGHLRKLGEALDLRLFEARGKRLVPTDAALALLQGALETFAALERCEGVLGDLRRAAAAGYRASSTGTAACSSARCATEPSSAPVFPLRPREPITIRSAPMRSASSAIVGPGSPTGW